MECKKERNLKFCNCTYDPCPRKGICCDCLQYHLRQKQLPAFFKIIDSVFLTSGNVYPFGKPITVITFVFEFFSK